MSKIKYTSKKIIDCSDWDDLVIETYGKPYCFQQQNGCQSRGNFNISIPQEDVDELDMPDSIPEVINGNEMGVKFEAWLARDPKEWNGKEEDRGFVDMFWDRNFYPDIQVIANDMYKKGLVDAGDYIINIDW